MKCEEMQELLSALADDALDTQEAVLVERHLQGCRECRAEAKTLAAMKDAVRRSAHARAPEDLRDALFAAAGRRRALPPRPVAPVQALPFSWGFAAAFAAAVLVVAVRARVPEETVVPVDFMLAAHDAYALSMPLAPAEELTPALAERLAGAGEE